MDNFTIREAAEQFGISYSALRKRVDRGTVRTVKQGNLRLIPRSELERSGLIPDTEIRQLRERLAELERENAALRQLPAKVEEETKAREAVELALHEERAGRRTAEDQKATIEEQLREIDQARIKASSTLERVAGASFFERRRLLRELRSGGVDAAA